MGQIKATKLGKKWSQVKHVDGTIKNVVLYTVKFCTAAKVNLLPITALLLQGSIMAKDMKNNIVVSINSKKVYMDQGVNMRVGRV